MTLNCCSCFRQLERKPTLVYGKYGYCDSHIRRPLLIGYEQPSTVKLRASLGKEIVSHLQTTFKQKNNGRFLAVTLSGKVIAVCDSLEALNKEIVKKKLRENRENYYIERIGYPAVTQI